MAITLPLALIPTLSIFIPVKQVKIIIKGSFKITGRVCTPRNCRPLLAQAGSPATCLSHCPEHKTFPQHRDGWVGRVGGGQYPKAVAVYCQHLEKPVGKH